MLRCWDLGILDFRIAIFLKGFNWDVIDYCKSQGFGMWRALHKNEIWTESYRHLKYFPLTASV